VLASGRRTPSLQVPTLCNHQSFAIYLPACSAGKARRFASCRKSSAAGLLQAHRKRRVGFERDLPVVSGFL
jgi:hypothetical protein